MWRGVDTIVLSTPAYKKCEAIPRRACIEGSQTFVSLTSRLRSNQKDRPQVDLRLHEKGNSDSHGATPVY